MRAREYYLRELYPGLAPPLKHRYPLVSLHGGPGWLALGQCPLLMLVALTGSGKTTALNLLKRRLGMPAGDIIPSRRELTDWILFPLAQAVAGEPISPVHDRVERFAITRRFARQVEGGMAAIFSWLYLHGAARGPLLSEGIRGPGELEYALRHFPSWQIVELTLPALTRLRRLSSRDDRFDKAQGRADLAFLPRQLHEEALALLDAGEISPKALAIARAEAANYGGQPFVAEGRFSHYHRLDIAGLSPAEVADALADIVRAKL